MEKLPHSLLPCQLTGFLKTVSRINSTVSQLTAPIRTWEAGFARVRDRILAWARCQGVRGQDGV